MNLKKLGTAALYFAACRDVEKFCSSGDEDRNRLIQLYAKLITRWIADGAPMPCKSMKKVNDKIRERFGEEAVDLTKRGAWTLVRESGVDVEVVKRKIFGT